MPGLFGCLHFWRQGEHKFYEFSESLLLVDRLMPFLKSLYIRTDCENGSFQSLSGKGHGVVYRVCPESLGLSLETSLRNFAIPICFIFSAKSLKTLCHLSTWNKIRALEFKLDDFY